MGFLTTRWTLVRAAGGSPSVEQRAALESLCRSYWPPVHAYLRRRGVPPDEAEDLTQAFFARLLEKRDLRQADPGRGRFRSFLLGALQHFLANERDRSRRLKRGGGRAVLSLDFSSATGADSRAALEPVEATTPELEFERAWARTVIERALERLAEEQRHARKGAAWERLRPYLASAERLPSAAVARELGVSENAVRVAAHRLRRRFGELLRAEVRETVGPGEEEDEIRELRAALE